MDKAIHQNGEPSWIPQFDSNYVGNGANDLANKSYATAVAIGITSVAEHGVDINIEDFYNPKKFDADHAQAMMDVMKAYWNEIGNNLDNDVLHGMTTIQLDAAALIHDQ